MSQNYQAYMMLQKNTSHGVIVIGRANDYLCYKNLRALVRSILVKFAPKIAMKLAVFYPLFLGEICPQISRQIGQFFFANLPQKIPWNLTFLRNLSEALMTYERALVLNNPLSKWPTNRWFFTVFFTVDLNLPSWMGFKLIQHCMITVLKHHVDFVLSSKYLQ